MVIHRSKSCMSTKTQSSSWNSPFKLSFYVQRFFSFRSFEFWRAVIAECIGTYFLLFLTSCGPEAASSSSTDTSSYTADSLLAKAASNLINCIVSEKKITKWLNNWSHGLIYYIHIKAKCRHRKNWPVKRLFAASVYLSETPSPLRFHSRLEKSYKIVV